jgi:hypothetical protein
MTIEEWLKQAIADADRRQLAALRPQLESIARFLERLRQADFNQPSHFRS